MGIKFNIIIRKVDPVGGASRFVKLVKKLKNENENCMILFSGDIYSPSERKQMVPVIDALNIDVTVVGNHDYDFGEENLLNLINSGTKHFPWLLSNLLHSKTNKSYTPGIEYFIKEINKIKIGFMGLIEYDWLSTINTIKKENYIYVDFIIKAKELVKLFKENGCDFIIALTHMRTYNDKILAECVPEIDIILGGHDHLPVLEYTDKNALIKSGSDFKNLTFNKITIYTNNNPQKKEIFSKKHSNLENREMSHLYFDKTNYGFSLISELFNVTKDLDEDEEIKEIVKKYQEIIKEEFKLKIINIYKSIDAKFNIVRSTGSSIGNFICDVTRIFTNTDICLMNSGTLRIDGIIEQGVFTYGGLKRLLPGEFFINRVYLTGNQILQSLENGVSRYPAFEGRFPMVSGIEFYFDPSKEKFKRVNPDKILINEEKIKMDKIYMVSLREYIHEGYDGYDMLTESRYISDHDDQIMLIDIINQFFKLVSMMPKKLKNKDEIQHEIYFGQDNDLKIIDYINKVTVELEGELSLNLELPTRIHIENS